MDVLESLKAISNYPIPVAVIKNAAQEYGVDVTEEADSEMRESAAYIKTKAAVLMFLSAAPNVSQGGISFSLTDKDKAMYRSKAISLLEDIGSISLGGIAWGYQGENL